MDALDVEFPLKPAIANRIRRTEFSDWRFDEHEYFTIALRQQLR